MIFTRLVLINFGLYQGKQVIYLTPGSKDDNYQPIILFGGKNGSGKTTIFEAINLCLYGRESVGVRVENARYDEYLEQRIHRRPGVVSNNAQAGVALHFEQAHAGVLDNYEVERTWNKSVNGVQESLLVKKNGRYLYGADSELGQEFVKDLIPPGIAQLFFIDGEKIQNLAEDESGNAALAEAIRATFGLNLVQQLKNDLNTFLRREQDKSANRELVEQLATLERELGALNEKVEIAIREEQDARVELIRITEQLNRSTQHLNREGKLLADRRKEVEDRKKRLEGEIEHLKKRIRGPLAEGLLPFAIIAEQCLGLREQLLKEEEFIRWHTAQGLLEQNSKQIFERLLAPEFWEDLPEVNPELVPKLTAKLEQQIKSLATVPARFENFELRHDLSETDRRQLLQTLNQLLNITPREVQAAFSELDQLTEQLKQTELEIAAIPHEEALQPLFEQEKQQRESKGAQEREHLRRKDILETLRREREVKEKTLAQVEQKIRSDRGYQERIGLAGRAQKVAERYYQQLLEDRVAELETTLVRYFGKLSRKRNLVWKARIDRQSFEVTLFTRDGQELPKKSLSAGEKQIYAISLLWALRDISGRPLPVVIDTPLGRLDSEHRHHIVKSYFPFASHQVLLLSTDTEINQTYLADLEPAISHSYLLEYNNDEGCTVVKEGYFWSKDELERQSGEAEEESEGFDPDFPEQELALNEA